MFWIIHETNDGAQLWAIECLVSFCLELEVKLVIEQWLYLPQIRMERSVGPLQKIRVQF